MSIAPKSYQLVEFTDIIVIYVIMIIKTATIYSAHATSQTLNRKQPYL